MHKGVTQIQGSDHYSDVTCRVLPIVHPAKQKAHRISNETDGVGVCIQARHAACHSDDRTSQDSPTMWILFHLCLFVNLRIYHSQLPLRSSDRKTECQIECPRDSTQRPVCGTDGRTYSSRCEINRAICEGHPVEFKHRGVCSVSARCESQRKVAQVEEAQRAAGAMPVFIPECKEDGSFMEVQCHTYTGYCWCVNHLGKPIVGSTVRHRKPSCTKPGTRSNTRRSPPRGRERKACDTKDRSVFSANLIKIFETEYGRIVQPSISENSTEQFDEIDVNLVVQWKFGELDRNKDDVLRRREVRDLRRMAKKIVQPRSCAKTFTKYCDMNEDKKISRREWATCLGADLNKEQNADGKQREVTTKADDRTELWNMQRPTLIQEQKPIESDSFEDDLQDCHAARQAALETDKQNPSSSVFIPDCTPEGHYVREQCHHSTGYCWCVNPSTGKPIRGTATHRVPPDCKRTRNNARMFKGCSPQKRLVFLEQLLASIEDQIDKEPNATEISSVSVTKRSEEVVKWKFHRMDINNNQYLDKKEWLLFRREWKTFSKASKRKKQIRKIRKCWRNFTRFCDANHNNKITMEEWLSCTGTISEDNNGLSIIVKGPNPFDKILRDD